MSGNLGSIRGDNISADGDANAYKLRLLQQKPFLEITSLGETKTSATDAHLRRYVQLGYHPPDHEMETLHTCLITCSVKNILD